MKDIQQSIDAALDAAGGINGNELKCAMKVACYLVFALCKAIYWGLGKCA